MKESYTSSNPRPKAPPEVMEVTSYQERMSSDYHESLLKHLLWYVTAHSTIPDVSVHRDDSRITGYRGINRNMMWGVRTSFASVEQFQQFANLLMDDARYVVYVIDDMVLVNMANEIDISEVIVYLAVLEADHALLCFDRTPNEEGLFRVAPLTYYAPETFDLLTVGERSGLAPVQFRIVDAIMCRQTPVLGNGESCGVTLSFEAWVDRRETVGGVQPYFDHGSGDHVFSSPIAVAATELIDNILGALSNGAGILHPNHIGIDAEGQVRHTTNHRVAESSTTLVHFEAPDHVEHEVFRGELAIAIERALKDTYSKFTKPKQVVLGKRSRTLDGLQPVSKSGDSDEQA